MGMEVAGVLEADSPEIASNVLGARGLIPSEVTRAVATGSRFRMERLSELFSPIKAAELIIFTKQFRTMLRSGVPMIKLLQVLETQTENPSLKKIIGIIADDIREGASLHDAFRKHPKAFTQLYCSMIQAGEASGRLPEVMERLSYIIEHENKIKSDIRSAFQYPIIVLLFLLIAFFVLLTFVIPKFVRIFIGAGLDLPLATRICMVMYETLSTYWTAILGALLASGIALVYYFRTQQGRYVRDAFFLQLPVIGPLFVKAAMSRFASIFAILQASGVEIRESMRILSSTIGNSAISREFDRVNSRLEEGRGISEPLRNTHYFTPIVVNMIGIGEESGTLDEMLEEVSAHYDFEVEYSMNKLGQAIGPVLTIGLAAVVGFFALAIFLPMWDMTQMVR